MTKTIGQPASLLEYDGAAERREMLAHVDRFVAKHYGERCAPAEPGCSCCVAWAVRDALAMAVAE